MTHHSVEIVRIPIHLHQPLPPRRRTPQVIILTRGRPVVRLRQGFGSHGADVDGTVAIVFLGFGVVQGPGAVEGGGVVACVGGSLSGEKGRLRGSEGGDVPVLVEKMENPC